MGATPSQPQQPRSQPQPSYQQLFVWNQEWKQAYEIAVETLQYESKLHATQRNKNQALKKEINEIATKLLAIDTSPSANLAVVDVKVRQQAQRLEDLSST